MLADNKVKCYKEMCAFLSKDEEVKGLGAPEPRQNFDLIYHINDVLFTYSLMSRNDYLKYSAEFKLKDKIDEIELKRIADKLRDNDEVISIVAYDNYIKLQMAVQLANMPEENAMSFVYEKAVYFHNKIKAKVLNFDMPTIEVEYKGKVISNNEDEQYIGKNKFDKKKKDIMGQYLEHIKVSHDDSMEYSGILNGHAISDLKNNVMEYKYVKGELTLKYVADKNILIDDTLKESTAMFDKNICVLSKAPTKLTEIETAVNDMVSIINYINNNSSFILSDAKVKTNEKEDKEMDNADVKPVKKEVTNNEVAVNAETSSSLENTSIETNNDNIAPEDTTITATLFDVPVRKSVDSKKEIPKNTEDKVAGKESKEDDAKQCEPETKDEKKDDSIETSESVKTPDNKYENADVQQEYMKMYKHMNEIYDERDNVFLIKQAKLIEREQEVEKEQQNIREIRSSLNKKWNDYNIKQKALNDSLSEYAEKMKLLNEKEIEIAKATSKLEEEKKSYETKKLALDDRQAKYEHAKRNLLDEQSMTIELKNNLEERETKLKLREADIEKKIQMNNLAQHQLSVREQTLNARKKENINASDEELETLKANIEKAKAENDALQKDIDQMQIEMENLVTACNKQLKNMEQKANKLVATYKNTPVVDEGKLDEKQKIIDTLNAEIEKLNENLKTKDKVSKEYYSLKDSIESVEQEKKTIEEGYNELLNTNNSLEEKIVDLEKSINEYKNKCEPDISARTTKELLVATGYDFDLIPTEGDVIVGCEIDNLSICINENAKMIYAEKPVKKGVKFIAKAKDWNDESISAAYVVLNDKVICKKAFDSENVVADVQDIIEKFSSVK